MRLRLDTVSRELITRHTIAVFTAYGCMLQDARS